MAGQLYGFNQVFDANGNPIPGALLFTYVPGTTTPKATYTSSTLATPLPNPVVADSAGRFPQIFADTSEVYDLVLQTVTDVTTSSFYDVTALGAGAGVIVLDFGLDGRLALTPEGGRPSIDFGFAAGDNVGGDGRIGGWAGTQGDNLLIDFDEVDITGVLDVTGGLNVSGPFTATGTTPFQTVTSAQTITAATSVDVPLSPSYSAWELRLKLSNWSNGALLTFRVSYDGGSTYKSGASDYSWTYYFNDGAAFTAANSGGDTSMQLMTPLIGGTPRSSAVVIRVNSAAGEYATLAASGTHAYNSFISRITTGGGFVANSTFGKATNIRILCSSAITGSVSVIGVPLTP